METAYVTTDARNPAALNRPEGPLSQEVLDTLGRAQDQAYEIRHRLYQLRDRLLGSPPTEATNGANKQNEAASFKAAHSERSSQLLITLSDIDAISNDLANRL